MAGPNFFLDVPWSQKNKTDANPKSYWNVSNKYARYGLPILNF